MYARHRRWGGQHGFTLVWAMSMVVVLVTVVTAALVWSRYSLRMGGLGQIQDVRSSYGNDVTLSQNLWGPIQNTIQNDLANTGVSTWDPIASSDLANYVNTNLIPDLRSQGYTASVVTAYQNFLSSPHVYLRIAYGKSSALLDISFQPSSWLPIKQVWVYSDMTLIG